MTSRARVRHHCERIKNQRARYLLYINNFDLSLERLGKLIATPKPCSCSMCGNPRKIWREVTMRERRNELHYQLELKSYIEPPR